MALPSQSARSRNSSYGPRFTVSRRRPRRGRARLLIAVLLLAGGLTAITMAMRGGGDDSERMAANIDATNTDQPGGAIDANTENAAIHRDLGTPRQPAPQTPSPAPRDLVMGERPSNTGGNTGGGGNGGGNGGGTQPTQRDPLQLPEQPRDPKPETVSPPAGSTPSSAPANPAPQRPANPPQTTRAPEVQSLIDAAEQFKSQGRIVQARDAFNRALHHPRASRADRSLMRTKLTEVSNELTFSSKIVPGDEMTASYTVKSGDLLSTIVRREGLDVEWLLIARVNNVRPERIRVGQTLKMVRGPFHAIISKSEYRLDLYSDFRDSGGNRLYLKSFNVGLGEYDSTPVGSWVVRTNSKLIDPAWVNPRTGERFASKDPENPIGNRWVGMRGTDSNTEKEEGIGIHGTIEPDSIGQQASMGCIRMLKADVELIYELLMPDVSTVIVQP